MKKCISPTVEKIRQNDRQTYDSQLQKFVGFARKKKSVKANLAVYFLHFHEKLDFVFGKTISTFNASLLMENHQS